MTLIRTCFVDNFCVFREKVTEAIVNIVRYSITFSDYSISRRKNTYTKDLIDNFARRLFVWRRPYPKFRQSQASAFQINISNHCRFKTFT